MTPPTPNRPRLAADPEPDSDSGDLSPSAPTEDRLFALLAGGQKRQERLMEGVREDIQDLTKACHEMASKVEGQAVTKSLVYVLVVGMLVCLAMVAISSGAQLAISTGWLHISTAPGGAAPISVPEGE